MAVIEGGTSAVLADVGAVAAKGMHVIAKPTDYGALGHYSLGVSTGILPAALGANSEVFQFRWVDATRLCAVTKIEVAAAVTTTMFAAGVPVEIAMTKATVWTGQGTLGTPISPAALLKMRTSMGSSLVGSGDIRVATTAALGAGTKTLEGNHIANMLAGGPITASLNGTFISPGTKLFEADVGHGDHPLMFVQNEGFVIRSVAVPATGTWRLSVNVYWAELTAF